jgi:EAL domain-containing protein (putative c-di-GMP-specific phosphodiesterase class I)
VAVDDLGAGYSSLSALAAFKPEFMKVDMSIVRGADADAHKRQLLELLAQFARATGATLIAEGVETRAETETLTACGAHWMQGFLWGRPLL